MTGAAKKRPFMEQMVRSLCHVKHIQFVPNEIVKKLDYQDTMHRFDKKMLRNS